jgi:hypothetical protein
MTSSACRWPMSSRGVDGRRSTVDSGKCWAGVLLLALMGCADLERGPRAPEPDAGPDVAPAEVGGGDAGVSFASVFPLIDGACKRCHAPGGMAADSKFLLSGQAATDYTAVRALVDPAAPAGSRLLAKASGQGHSGGVIYRMSSMEYAALLAWIASGAAP